MGPSPGFVLDADARRRLWQAYQVVLDCARRGGGETTDDSNGRLESSPAPDTTRRVRNVRLMVEKAHE